MQGILSFIGFAEKLKTTLRHSWTNDSARQESVAEHSWMICLVAMVLFKKTDLKLDELKVLKMLVVHDLAEALTGDIPLGEQGVGFDRNMKLTNEREALHTMTADLAPDIREELLTLWDEYELRETNEARFAKAMDSVEATIQHTISDFSTWDQTDYNLVAVPSTQKFFDFDMVLKEFNAVAEAVQMKKIIAAGLQSRLPPLILERYVAKLPH